jgi:hypothetical protein
MSFGSGMSRQQQERQSQLKPPPEAPMERTDEIGSIVEAIKNPWSIITGDTKNNRLLTYYTQLREQNNRLYDKIQFSTSPSKTNADMEKLGFKKYYFTVAGGVGGGMLPEFPLPIPLLNPPPILPSDQELQEIRNQISRMEQYINDEIQKLPDTTPTPTPTTTEPQSAEYFFSKSRIDEILKNPNSTTADLNAAIELFNNIEDLENIKIRTTSVPTVQTGTSVPTRQITQEDYSDYKNPNSSSSSSSSSSVSMTMTPTPLIRKPPTFLQTTINPLEYKQVLQLSTKKNKNKKGVNITVLKRILQRLIADRRGLIPLLIDDLQSVINQPAFSTMNQPNPTKKALVKQKTSNSKIKTAIIDRVLAFNEELQQTILNIITFYYSNTVDDFTTDNVIDEIMNTTDMVNLSKFYKALLKAIKDSIKKLNYPEWFYNLFQPIPIDLVIEDVPMAPSIRDSYNSLLPILIQPMLKIGMSPTTAQELALKIIESKALQELTYIYENADWQGTIDQLIKKTIEDVNDAIDKESAGFKLNPVLLFELMYEISKEIKKQLPKSYIAKLIGVVDLTQQIITETPIQDLEIKLPSLTVEEFQEVLQEDKKNDFVNIGGKIRIKVRNLDRINIPPIITNFMNKIKIGKKKRTIDYDFIMHFDDPDEPSQNDDPEDPDDDPDYGDYGDDPDDPDEPDQDVVFDIFYRGQNRTIKLKTLILALLGIGTTITTIYKVIKRILKMEEHNIIEDYKNSDNIEETMPDLDRYKLAYLQVAQAYLKAQEDGKDEATLQKYRNQLLELKTIIDKITQNSPVPISDIKTPDMTGGKPNLENYKNSYTQLNQQYITAQKEGKDEATLQKYRTQLTDLKNIIDKATQDAPAPKTGYGLPDLDRYKKAYDDLNQVYIKAIESGKDEATLQKYKSQLLELQNIINKLGESIGTTGETPDSIVNFNSELETGTDEGMLRATVIDPNEVQLFLNTNKVAKEQQKMFNNFSKVAPGHGLGDYQYNGLARFNKREEDLRFQNKVMPSYNPQIGYIEKPYINKSVDNLELTHRRNKNQPIMIDTIQNEFGHVQFEVDGNRGNNLMGNHFTRTIPNSNITRDNENEYSIYDPELVLSRYRMKGTKILENRMNGYDYGLPNEKPSTQSNILISDRLTGYDYTPLMRNDIFNQQKVKIVKNNIDTFNQRIVSSRH